MPVFDYQCSECDKTYDVFHKGREIIEDIECPKCGSRKYRKLMSAPMVAVSGGSGKSSSSSENAAGNFCCGGGSCGLN